MGFRIKNWHKFQHFKDRMPPWVKLHKSILDDRDIMAISSGAFRVIVFLWLIASEDVNKVGTLPCIEDIAFRIRMDEAELCLYLAELEPFLDGYDIGLISTRCHVDAPETETEAEAEKRHKDICVQKNQRKKFIKPTIEQITEYCIERKNNIDPQQFIDHYESNGWRVGKAAMKNWQAAIRTWEKNNVEQRTATNRRVQPPLTDADREDIEALEARIQHVTLP